MRMKDKVKIGLEVHIPLNTKSKLFCGCSTEIAEPNTNVCGTCLGMPGSKPRLNKEVVNKAIQLALCLNSKLGNKIVFSRKTYFYPDLPKNFQITQYENPIAMGGSINIGSKEISIRRLQIEEDPGSLQHKNDYSLIDYNRSGIPLIELVSEPEFSDSKEVAEFMQELLTILDYLEIYNPKDYTFRADLNVSVNDGERIEIKNVSGVKSIQKAIDFEVSRQIHEIRSGKKIQQRTVHFDKDTGETFASRSKETEEDYGYISEPDLSIIEINKKDVLKIKNNLPELPSVKRERFRRSYSLNYFESQVITGEKEIADMYERLRIKLNVTQLKNWIIVTLKKVLNYNSLKFKETGISDEQVMTLIKGISSGEFTQRGGEFILRELVKKPEKVEVVAKRLGLSKISDADLEKIIKQVVMGNLNVAESYRTGKTQALQYLVGQVIRESKGRADPIKVADILTKILSS